MLGNFFSPKKATPPAPSTPTPTKGGKASTGRLNLKSIPKEAPPAPKKLASVSAGVKLPAFSFGAKKPAASAEPTARVVNGKLQVCRGEGGREGGREEQNQREKESRHEKKKRRTTHSPFPPSLLPLSPPQGYFTNEQIEALEIARREVPSSVPSYWNKIAAKVPGQTPETCKAMVNQILLDKARGTGKQFFGGYVEVKETKMVVDTEATVAKRFKAAFGIK
jgi:hypothetical protein